MLLLSCIGIQHLLTAEITARSAPQNVPRVVSVACEDSDDSKSLLERIAELFLESFDNTRDTRLERELDGFLRFTEMF